MNTYEQQLSQDVRWALIEGSMHFEKESAVYKSLERITGRLDGLGIPYALVGAMAMFLHGFRRFTEDVDLLVTEIGLKNIRFRPRHRFAGFYDKDHVLKGHRQNRPLSAESRQKLSPCRQ